MSIHSFEVTKTNGTKTKLTKYKGKVLVIVNTASKCQFTPQFDDLQKLYDQYKDSGLEILGFPCNQFGEQEPGTNEEAATFCKMNYGVTFPIFAKVDVIGKNASPLFYYLKKKTPFQDFDESNISNKLLKMMIAEKYPEFSIGDEIKWNFTKFLVDQDGNVIKRYESTVGPMKMAEDIEKLLATANIAE